MIYTLGYDRKLKGLRAIQTPALWVLRSGAGIDLTPSDRGFQVDHVEESRVRGVCAVSNC